MMVLLLLPIPLLPKMCPICHSCRSSCKIIRFRFDSNVIDELLRIKWWNYNYSDLPDNNKCDDINYFVEEMNRLISNGNIQEMDYKNSIFLRYLETYNYLFCMINGQDNQFGVCNFNGTASSRRLQSSCHAYTLRHLLYLLYSLKV